MIGSRHFILPDRQAKHGVPLDHNRWIGQAIREYKPDVVIDLGDNNDFASLSRYEAIGSKAKEGSRLIFDIEAANEAEDLLAAGMGGFKPKKKVRLRGNHEKRLDDYVDSNPVLEGLIGTHLLHEKGWQIVKYFNGSPGIIKIEGIAYAHFFANPNTGKPISGTINNRLSKIGMSFVQGHAQGLLQGNVQYATGHIRHGIVAGSCYLHDENFKGHANAHWRGVVVLNEVRDGQFCEMPLTLNYLCQKYEGTSLKRFLQRKYRNAAERFSLAA
jgi:hypothetical protein